MSAPLPTGAMPEIDRTRYAPSGEISIPLLGVMVGPLLVVSVALAFALAGMRYTPFSLVIYLPIIAGVILGFVGGWLLRQAHVRNSTVAWSAAVVLGLITYLGQFHALAIFEWGWMAVPRIDLLPVLIYHDVNNWVIGAAAGPQQGGNPLPAINWILFIAELGLLCAVAGALMAAATAKVYCERCQNWASELSCTLPMDGAPLVLQKLLGGRLQELAVIYPVSGGDEKMQSTLTLESCLHGGDGRDAIAYLSAASGAGNANGVKTDLYTQVKITTDEMAILAQRVQGLIQ